MADSLCLLEDIPEGTGRGFTLKSSASGDPRGLDILYPILGFLGCHD